jgi:hypothetical protein
MKSTDDLQPVSVDGYRLSCSGLCGLPAGSFSLPIAE